MRINLPSSALTYRNSGHWADIRLNDAILHHAHAYKDRPAIRDCPSKEKATGLKPLNLTWSQFARTIENYARTLKYLGMERGDIIAIQMPNIVETYLITLAAQHMGAIPALIPPHWRRYELNWPLAHLAPRMLIGTADEINPTKDLSAIDRLALAAADLMTVRQVAAFAPSNKLLDGIINFYELTAELESASSISGDDEDLNNSDTPTLTQRPKETLSQQARREKNKLLATKPDQLSLIAWHELSYDAHVPIPFCENHLIAAAAGFIKAAQIEPMPRILSCFAPHTIASRTTSLVPTIIYGGSLQLHLASSLESLAKVILTETPDLVTLPAHLLAFLEPVFATHPTIKPVAVYNNSLKANQRAEQLERIDFFPIGELAHMTRKADKGKPVTLKSDKLKYPFGNTEQDLLTINFLDRQDDTSEICCKGSMVPDFTYPSYCAGIAGPILKKNQNDLFCTGITTRSIDGIFHLPDPIYDDYVVIGGHFIKFMEMEAMLVEMSEVREVAFFVTKGKKIDHLAVAVVPERNSSDITLEKLHKLLDRIDISTLSYPKSLKIVTTIPMHENGQPDRNSLAHLDMQDRLNASDILYQAVPAPQKKTA